MRHPSQFSAHQRFALTAKLLNETMFPGKLDIHYGPSATTLPLYMAQHPAMKCDLLSIDGLHNVDDVMRDWAIFRRRLRGGALVFIDNSKPQGKLGFDRTAPTAWSRLLATREVRPVGCKVHKGKDLNTTGKTSGGMFCVGEFVGQTPRVPPKKTNA